MIIFTVINAPVVVDFNLFFNDFVPVAGVVPILAIFFFTIDALVVDRLKVTFLSFTHNSLLLQRQVSWIAMAVVAILTIVSSSMIASCCCYCSEPSM
jgi:hypothetical protein